MQRNALLKPLLLVLLPLWFSPALALQPVGLRCEYLSNPLGIDASRPRLSWVLESATRGDRQSAYHILVATSPQLLEGGRGDLWDSGKVQSNQSIQVTYAGQPLKSRTRCWWKVRVWDKHEQPSDWSRPAMWSMGMLGPEDWHGRWIGTGEIAPAPEQPPLEYASVLLRKEVSLERKPVLATAYVCGLGYYELYINGKKIGDHVLDPGFTDYNKRVLYVTYDVTASLRQGSNAVGVLLGNGWYHSPTPDLFGLEKAPWKSSPKLLLNVDLEFGDGTRQTLASDSSWKWSAGPIVFNCIRGGETYDARMEKDGWNEPGYDDRDWKPARTAPSPAGRLVAQKMAPMRVTEIVKPVKLTEPKPGVFVFDLGLNLTGWVRFEASGEPGQKIRLEFNEHLLPDGTLDTKYSHSHTYGRFQTGELILGPQGKGVFQPRFTYHGFRYVQVTGLKQKPLLEHLMGHGVHTDWTPAGEFSCSNPKINQVQKALVRTLNNCVHSIPGEEPTREKMGWTQDGLNTMEAAVYNFDVAAVYTKYLHDMIDAQEPNGHVPPIVPTNGWGRTKAPGADFSDPWWGGTLLYVAEKLYEYYGDRRALEEAYEPMKRWVDYLGSTAKDHLIDWWLGDWLEPGAPGRPKRSPIIQTSTAGYFYCAMAVSRAADLLGKKEEARRYAALAGAIRDSFNGRFLDPRTSLYAKDSQTCQVLPLFLGMAPPDARDRVFERLLENIKERKNHLGTGFVGVMPLLHGLTDWGYGSLAYTLAAQEDVPGFYQMVADGNSTMGESLDGGSGSRHHPFGACIGSWYYRALGGIRTDPAGPGFKKFIIKPEIVGDLTWVKASYRSVHGTIRSSWNRADGILNLDITVPVNTTATFHIPAKDPSRVSEGGKPAGRAPGVKFLRADRDAAVFEVGSGDYNFRSR